jgi:hypothetical protein
MGECAKGQSLVCLTATVSMSALEIYNEVLVDMLNVSDESSARPRWEVALPNFPPSKTKLTKKRNGLVIDGTGRRRGPSPVAWGPIHSGRPRRHTFRAQFVAAPGRNRGRGRKAPIDYALVCHESCAP